MLTLILPWVPENVSFLIMERAKLLLDSFISAFILPGSQDCITLQEQIALSKLAVATVAIRFSLLS